MNRALQRRTTRRFAARKFGGGYGMGAPLVTVPSGPGSDFSFAVKQPVNQGFDDCAFPARNGELYNQPNPALAQVAMVGGGSSGYHSPMYMAKELPTGPVNYTYSTDPSRAAVAMAGGQRLRSRRMRGGAVLNNPMYIAKELSQVAHTSGGDATKYGDVSMAQTVMAGGRRANCGCSGSKLLGGSRKQRGGAGCGMMRGGAGCGTMRGGAGCGMMRGGAGCGMMRGGAGCGMMRGGAGCGTMRGGSKKQRGGAGCGTMRGGSRKQSGGAGCGTMRGGSKKQRGGAGCGTMRGGGTYGYIVDPSVSVGGTGPNVAPLYTGVPCDGRAGYPNMLNPTAGNPDPRAPADLYSFTTNQTAPAVQAGGGVADGAGPAMVGSQPPSTSYGHGNAYGPEFYKAPGSELPVYNADIAGFNFRPSTVTGGTLPDGVTAYNDVVPQAARVGGGRRRRGTRFTRRSHRKSKRGTKHYKH